MLYELSFKFKLDELNEFLSKDLIESEFKILENENIYESNGGSYSCIVDLNHLAFK